MLRDIPILGWFFESHIKYFWNVNHTIFRFSILRMSVLNIFCTSPCYLFLTVLLHKTFLQVVVFVRHLLSLFRRSILPLRLSSMLRSWFIFISSMHIVLLVFDWTKCISFKQWRRWKMYSPACLSRNQLSAQKLFTSVNYLLKFISFIDGLSSDEIIKCLRADQCMMLLGGKLHDY